MKKKLKTQKNFYVVVVVFNLMCMLSCVVLVLGATTMIVGGVGENNLSEMIKQYHAVDYGDNRCVPIYEDGGSTFHTDGSLKIMQLTDIHLGMGGFSITEDRKAINAIAAMITAEKPDLVVFTGDQVFSIPIWSGNMDNLKGYLLLAKLMEKLQVYWTFTFGNHDAETYNYYTKEDIGVYMEDEQFTYCLYENGSNDVDGCGNHYINVKNKQGFITQSIIMLDSNTYVNDDGLGIKRKYDNIHQNQINWYEETVKQLTEVNANILNEDAEAYILPVKSLLFYHIPIAEYKDAYNDYINGGEDSVYYYGEMNDSGIYCGTSADEVFETCLKLGSTQGMFCGHDHLNNFSIEYKGIRLTYGMSIDYLAYFGIEKTGKQRGCTLITINTDTTFSCESSSYYQDKYKTFIIKEKVNDI